MNFSHPYTIMALAWVACAIWIAFVISTNKKAHPKALFYLFFVEMWERFSYYGMRALLVLYMTKGFLNYENTEAYGVYGAYGALVYATPLLGGLLAERFMGYRKSIMWGAILMMAGHFLMAFEQDAIFFTALSLLIIGNGFFKPNISSMIGKFYARNDPRRDGAFTIFYMGINIGAFLTGLTCGVVGEIEGWHYGFTLAGVGMFVGLIIFYMAQRSGALEDKGYAPHEVEEIENTEQDEDHRVEHYKKIDNPVSPKILGLPANLFIYIASLVSIPLIWQLIKGNDVLDYILLTIGFAMVIYLIATSFKYDKVKRERIWVIILLFFFAIIFWTFFELAGSALTIFTDNNVTKSSFFTTTMFQSLNPFFIMIFAPVFAWMWLKLAKAKKEPAAPVKFGVGLLLLGAGFLVLKLGEGTAQLGMISGMFMVFLYLLHTLGELALSPVGLSMVTKLSPMKIVGFVMGFWMMASSFAHQGGKHIANMTAIEDEAIITSEEFRSNVKDDNVLKVMDGELFQLMTSKITKDNQAAADKYKSNSDLYDYLKDDHGIMSAVNSPYFVDELNKVSGTKQYHLVTAYDKALYDKAMSQTKAKLKKDGLAAATNIFVTNDAKIVSNSAEKLFLSAEQIAAAKGNAINKNIQIGLSTKTLKLGIDIFTQLGFIAIGAGLFLLLLSPIVSKWMHGIK